MCTFEGLERAGAVARREQRLGEPVVALGPLGREPDRPARAPRRAPGVEGRGHCKPRCSADRGCVLGWGSAWRRAGARCPDCWADVGTGAPPGGTLPRTTHQYGEGTSERRVRRGSRGDGAFSRTHRRPSSAAAPNAPRRMHAALRFEWSRARNEAAAPALRAHAASACVYRPTASRGDGTFVHRLPRVNMTPPTDQAYENSTYHWPRRSGPLRTMRPRVPWHAPAAAGRRARVGRRGRSRRHRRRRRPPNHRPRPASAQRARGLRARPRRRRGRARARDRTPRRPRPRAAPPSRW